MLWWFIQNMFVAGALTGMVWLACRVWRLSPAARHALWLVVLLKLVTPPLVAWPWSLPNLVESSRVENASSVLARRESPINHSAGSERQSSQESAGQGELHTDWPEYAQSLDVFARADAGVVDLHAPRAGIDEAPVDGTARRSTVDDGVHSRRAAVSAGMGLAGIMRGFGPVVMGLWLSGVVLSVVVHAVRIARFVGFWPGPGKGRRLLYSVCTAWPRLCRSSRQVCRWYRSSVRLWFGVACGPEQFAATVSFAATSGAGRSRRTDRAAAANAAGYDRTREETITGPPETKRNGVPGGRRSPYLAESRLTGHATSVTAPLP
jgi:hypothetical protein